MKTCSRCGKDRPEDEFNKNRATEDGLTAYCKLCIKEYRNQNNGLKPENWKRKSVDRKAYQKEYQRKMLEKDPEYWVRREKLALEKDPDRNRKKYRAVLTKDPDYYRRKYRERVGALRNPLTAEEKLLRRRARLKVQKYVAAGKIQKMPCEICRSIEVEAHHEDYSKPLEVKWLCRAHHLEKHRRSKAP